MDIGAWLRGIGLERYEQAFRVRALSIDHIELAGVSLRRRFN
jgi:hypothetical protein